MSVINATIAASVNRNLAANAQTSTAQTTQSQSSGGGFGDAVNLNLSAPAQAALGNQGAAPSTPPSGGGGGVPVGISSSSGSSDETLLVEEAKQKVIPEVGVSGADDVVDNKGNIDQVKLDQLIAKQEAEQATKQAENG